MSPDSAAIRIAAWLVSLLVPILLVIGGIRLLMTPSFLSFEYATPNFPADFYGFTREDRLFWSQATLVYLTEGRGIPYLESLAFEDGIPIYNQRELGHLADVERVWNAAKTAWLVGALLMAGLGVWAWVGGWWKPYLRAVGRGGLLTAVLIGVLIFFVLVAFGVFFVLFHQVFFQAGTWQFFYSDTLIRLFPERFWRDAFLVIGVLSAGIGLLLWYLLIRRGQGSPPNIYPGIS